MSFKYRDFIAKVWNAWKVEIIHGLDPVVSLYDFIYISFLLRLPRIVIVFGLLSFRC